MARWLTVAVAVVVLVTCGSSFAATSTGGLRRCGPAGAKTLASSSGARVYAQGGFVYACARASGRRYQLGPSELCGVGPTAAGGLMVAYGARQCGIDTETGAVYVRRLSNGAQLLTRAAFTGPRFVESSEWVGSIVVNRRGAVAWIGVYFPAGADHLLMQVDEATPSGVHVLASGMSIARGSLRLHGSTLTWKAGGSEHSAKLS